MNAIELTKMVNQMSDRLIKLEKTVKFLENENDKLRLIVKDLQIDVAQIERGGSRR